MPLHRITPEPSKPLTIKQKLEMPTVYAKTADSRPGGAIFAKMVLEPMAQSDPHNVSKIVFPSRKNTLSGMPMTRFHRIMMITSIIDAADPIVIVRNKTGLNFQVLKHPW
mmetsp:Transcript_1058/g.2421  ORF Transcript_1058/g.2421 Transcript_1058/m.2421 type:complete len:110 (-) Transcript_1058:1527-1856(-)